MVEDQANVTERSETTTDVTLQYSDLESRKKTLTTEQERIWALLEKADTLEAVIALEERLVRDPVPAGIHGIPAETL